MSSFKKYKNNFISRIIEKDLNNGKCDIVHTRFSPEPNGYLHIGHAKSICLNFGIAQYHNGICNLRFDDTNPINECLEYVESIKYDVKWLGFQWHNNVCYSSNYFNQLYQYAIELINKGLAYVDELSPKEIREYRGTLTSPGKDSPYRNRSINDNIKLFNKMRNGSFEEGKACLRAKIDMTSSFTIMRDPILYRIKYKTHHQTGNQWCIYPMYDFAHCISDSIEGITHSLCTLEFQDNRRLYDWILSNITILSHPRQYEFSRLNLEYTVMSKRKLSLLVQEKRVDGWNDPRMPTISGMRRRGYSSTSIRRFCERIGISKQDNNIKMEFLESCIREDLNKNSPRVMVVIDPVKLIIKNYPHNIYEMLTIPNHPQRIEMDNRKVPFSKEIWIDRADFRYEDNDKQYKRLVLGKEVRLRYAYVVKAENIEKDIYGDIKTIYCTYDANTLNKNPIDGRKIKGVIHWVSAFHAFSIEIRLYDKLFRVPNPGIYNDFINYINEKSLIIKHGYAEPALKNAEIGKVYQFEREGYFCLDIYYSNNKKLVFNRTVTLRKSW